jgi:hypothetical protein
LNNQVQDRTPARPHPAPPRLVVSPANNQKFHIRKVLQWQNHQRNFYGFIDILSLIWCFGVSELQRKEKQQKELL